MTIQSFQDLPLADPIRLALSELNYSLPSPIQAAAIPPQLAGRDCIGCAQTGTGKTAAFALPLLHELASNPERPFSGCTRALVLTPTRELAVQVGESFARYGKHLKFRKALVYGGVNQHSQVKAMRRGVDVLVATPGRLLDLINQGHISLEQVRVLVLDEVDRMLDMGFIHDVKKLSEMIPADRRTAFFSATLNKNVRSVAARFVKDPFEIRIAPESPVVDRIEQQVCHVKSQDKLPLLRFFLEKDGAKSRILVFSRTKHGADKLAKKLKGFGIGSEAIHGNKTQASRQRALDRFKVGAVSVLVATDVAARGIDVKDISLVVNFDLPNEAETYVHRIGRTARADASGRAVSFCDNQTIGELRQIEKHLGGLIDVQQEQPYHDHGVAQALTAAKDARPGKGRQNRYRRGPRHRDPQPQNAGARFQQKSRRRNRRERSPS